MVAVALHDVRVPTQHWITHIALHLSGRDRPFIRARWRVGHEAPRPAPVAPSGRSAALPSSYAGSSSLLGAVEAPPPSPRPQSIS
jgi:hypothetical protein